MRMNKCSQTRNKENKKMRIQLSDHFTYPWLLRFVISPVLMMVFTSLYSIIDGFFVSNFVGKQPFAAVNLVMPIAMGIGTIGFMIGTGGSAVVSKTLGEGKRELASRYFSLLVYAALFFSILVSAVSYIFAPQIADGLGASGELKEYCVIYSRILFLAEPAFVLQNVFQNFFVTAEKPGLSLKVSILSGLTNAVLDFVFIVVFSWGISGAALATALGQVVGAVIPVVYFAGKNDSLLHLTKAPLYGKVLVQTFANGSSEMVSNLSGSVVNILYNFQLMRIAGEDGVAAYGVIMYANFVFLAVFIGYSIGSAPIVSYHYGAGNHGELKNLCKKSMILMGSAGIFMTVLAEIFSAPLVGAFAGYDKDLFAMTCRGFQLYSLCFLMMGFNVWGSAFFTALNNGVVSAVISFLRTFIFQIVFVFLLPILLQIDGIWLSVVAAEALALTVTIGFIVTKRKVYHYL